MSGWLLILALLLLGGVLSTLGDRLGTRVGKARLSLFNLRPRDTAVVITALTGALISAVSLGLMLLVSERLRVGLFQLDQIRDRLQQSRGALEDTRRDLRRSQGELARAEQDLRQAQQGRQEARASRDRAQVDLRRARENLTTAEARVSALRRELKPLQDQRQRLERERERLSREVKGRDAEIRRTEAELADVSRRIAAGEKELKQLETNVIALRRGDVVIASGQPLAITKVRLRRPRQEARQAIDALLREANLAAFRMLLPGERPDRRILLVPSSDVERLETLLRKPGTWVVSIRSAGNVLRGENRVLAFPDLRPNRRVVRRGEVLARTTLEGDVRAPQEVRSRLNLLLAAAFARAQRQGTLVDGLQFDAAAFNDLGRNLSQRPAGKAASLEAVALRDADTPDPILVELRWKGGGPVPRPQSP
ncbi:MAG: DUF3084 domain-containing protein [Synechococcaceae cyanobacterium]|nr:DUF3084 domain-containing protein [Synechococcaceae cyanobacterium]